MIKQESYKRENHLVLVARLQEILEMAGFAVEKGENDLSMVVTTIHGQLRVNLVQMAPTTEGFVLSRKKSPRGYKITFSSGRGETYQIKKWIGVKFDEEIGNWWFEPEKIVPKLKSIISGFDDFLSKEKEAKSIATRGRERLEKMFPDFHVSFAYGTGRVVKTNNMFTVENRTFTFTVWVSKGFAEGETDEITTSAITVRRRTEDLKDTPREFLKKLTMIDEVLHGRVVTKPEWAITHADEGNSRSPNKLGKCRVKDAAITYLRLEEHTNLTYDKIAELIGAELGSRTTAKSIAYYYSKFRESEGLLPRSWKQSK